MTFYGQPVADPKVPRPLRKFAYRVYDGASEQDISAHEIYFYEAGRIGFWNDIEDGERVLVLAIKAFSAREVVGG